MVVRPRWHDVLITLSIIALFATGVGAIWGQDLGALWRSLSGADQAPAAVPAATAPAPPPPVTPGT